MEYKMLINDQREIDPYGHVIERKKTEEDI